MSRAQRAHLANLRRMLYYARERGDAAKVARLEKEVNEELAAKEHDTATRGGVPRRYTRR